MAPVKTSPTKPTPIALLAVAIEEVANKLREACGLSNEVRASIVIERLCDRLNAVTRFVKPNDPEIPAGRSSEVGRDLKFTIYLPQSSSLISNNFNIARELGHLVLHFHSQPKGTLPLPFPFEKCEPDLEAQAYLFAIFLLLPRPLFTKLRDVLIDDLNDHVKDLDDSSRISETGRADDSERQKRIVESVISNLSESFEVPLKVVEFRIKQLKHLEKNGGA